MRFILQALGEFLIFIPQDRRLLDLLAKARVFNRQLFCTVSLSNQQSPKGEENERCYPDS